MEFHLSAKRVKAGSRKTALAVSAYIAGRTSVDGMRINNPHQPGDIAFTGMELPPGAHFPDAAAMWRAADQAERKKDGTYSMRGGTFPVVATHANLSIPWGSTEAQVREIARRVCEHLVQEHGVGVQYAAHQKEGRLDHIHFMWTSRTLSDSGFGGKARSLNAVATRGTKAKPGKNPMEELRRTASEAIFDLTGTFWDHRSFKRRGIESVPEPKIDRRRLREQQRRAEQAGDTGPTPLERELAHFRTLKKQLQAERNPIRVELVAPEPAPEPQQPPAAPQGAAERPPVPAALAPFNPFADQNGLMRDKQTQRIGATILKAGATGDRTLADATIGLLMAMMGKGVEAAHAVFKSVLDWAAKPESIPVRKRYADVKPFTPAELEELTTTAEASRRQKEQAANRPAPGRAPQPRQDRGPSRD